MNPEDMEAGEPQGIPEGAEAPQMEPQAPQMPPPLDPMAENTPENDVPEVEARDKLGLRLTLMADGMAESCAVARGTNDAKAAEAYASATHKLVQAIVLLTPVIAADDITGNGEGAGLASASRSRLDQ